MLKLCSLSLLDRHSHDSVEVQKEEEKKFKEVGEAYAVLSDQKKRSRYDNGHDLEDLDGGGFGRYLGKKDWVLVNCFLYNLCIDTKSSIFNNLLIFE